MSTKIDSLSIEIESSAGSAVENIERLAESLAKLRENAKLSEVTKELKGLADALKKLQGDSGAVSGVKKLTAATDDMADATRDATAAQKSHESAISATTFSVGTAILKLQAMARAFSWVKDAASSCISEAIEWDGVQFRFGRAFGEEAEEVYEHISQISDSLKINKQELMQYSSLYGTLLKGFGANQDKVSTIAVGLTELSYDIWAANNDQYKTLEEAAMAVRSAITGEIEPIRNAGIALSQASLQEYLNNGVGDEAMQGYLDSIGEAKIKVADLTEAQKAEVRYAVMMNSALNQGIVGTYAKEMKTAEGAVRDLSQQLKTLAQSIGSLLIPILQQLIPYARAVVELLTEMAARIAQTFDIPFFEIQWDGSNISAGANEAADSLDEAAEAAKKLKKFTMGIDELNIISSGTKSSDSSGAAWGEGLNLTTLWDDSVLAQASQQVDDLKEKMKPVLEAAIGIGTAIGAWAISGKLLKGIDRIKSLSSKNVSINFGLKFTGLALLVADVEEFLDYIKSIAENGANLQNVAGAISEFAGMMGDACLLMGNLKVGGALKAVQGVGEIVAAIKDISENGLDWDNAYTAIRGLTNVAIAIGGLTGKLGFVGAGMMFQGLNTIVNEIATNWEAIKQGDWSGVDKAAGIIAVIEVIAGIAAACGSLSNIKNIGKISKAATVTEEVATTTSNVGGAVGKLSGALKGVAANMGWGILVLTEVAAAAVIFVGAVMLIGIELKKAVEAWKPVLDNGDTLAKAIGIGTGLLVGIGLVTFALGTVTVSTAGLLPVAIAVGTAVLVELAAAFVLFTESLVLVADELRKNLAPALEKLNVRLPGLREDMSDFTDYMTEFATEVTDYTKSMGKLTWADIAGKFQGLFAKNPIKTLADNVEDIYEDTKALNEKLALANPEIQKANGLLGDYAKFMGEMKLLTEANNSTSLKTDMFANLKEVGKNLVLGFESGINSNANKALKAMENMLKPMLTKMNNFADACRTSVNTMLKDISKTMSSTKVSGNKVSYTVSKTPLPQRFADGGFIEDGLFTMNRGEIAGKFNNGKSVVANNDQIVDGIASGVRSANADVVSAVYAMSRQIVSAIESNGGDIYFDSMKVGAATTNAQNRRTRMYGKSLQYT